MRERERGIIGYDIKILPSGSFVYEDELKKDYEKENIIH